MKMIEYETLTIEEIFEIFLNREVYYYYMLPIKKIEYGFYEIENHSISFYYNTKTHRWLITDLTTGKTIDVTRKEGETIIKFLDWLSTAVRP